jgi:hypothetical protein
MSFQIGQTVQLNGKDYKITGTHAKSFLLERDGKVFKATAENSQKSRIKTPKNSHRC